MPEDGVAALSAPAGGEKIPPGKFVNPIGAGADPCVVKHGDRYLWSSTEGNRGVAISVSDKLNSLGRRHIIWKAPAIGPLSRQVWAPELIFHQDRWYIYFAASDGRNETHLSYVLASQSSDPIGEYKLHGPLYTGDDPGCVKENIWAIDMTVLDHGGQLYAIWSGWSDATSDQQYLYIAPMDSPTKISAPRVRVCANDDYLWERTEERLASRGLNEAPQVLKRGGRTFLIYSCGASWLKTYKLGMLELINGNPLDPLCWKKFPEPVFQSTPQTFGVGHGSFTLSSDNQEWWHVYHAKLDSQPGSRRAIFIQPMRWDKTGAPKFGTPVAAGEPLPLP
ncbi:MAG: glycoside hydrolase family 43 protein [Kiritimatiellae bacterium]|nr:glycoside hydrolase family 43 protein [Kiritimatiellia bacterium]